MLQEKDTIHHSITIWFTNLSYTSSYENSCSESSGGQGMGKLEKISAWNLTKVRCKKEVIDEARTKGAKVHVAPLMDLCHLKNAEVEAQKMQRSSCAPRWHCERWLWFLCSIHRTRIIIITNDSSQSNGCHIKTTRMRRTSSWRSICLNPSKNVGCSKNYCKFPNRNVQTFGFVYRSINGLIHGPVWKIQSFLSSESVWSSFGRTILGKPIWENPIAARLGKGFQLGMLVR